MAEGWDIDPLLREWRISAVFLPFPSGRFVPVLGPKSNVSIGGGQTAGLGGTRTLYNAERARRPTHFRRAHV